MFSSEPVKRLMIKAGTELLNKAGSTVKVCSAIIHSNYEKGIYDYDIAILKVYYYSLKIT